MPTIVILAAGKGSRYGKGIKQLTPIGPQGETIMEYSVRDAIAAGFNRFIFVISRGIYAEFNRGVIQRISREGIQYAIVYQDTPLYRSKPLGTGQAVMLCREYITEPFAVINADDYYGAEAMRKAYTFMRNNPKAYGMVGYTLCNTIYNNSVVTRGICEIDSTGRFVGIRETRNIHQYNNVIEGGTGQRFKGTEIVSMNFWLLPPSFVGIVTERFERFKQDSDLERDEYLLPNIVDDMIRNDNINVHILKINARCIGMTYEKDAEKVRRAILLEKTPPRGV